MADNNCSFIVSEDTDIPVDHTYHCPLMRFFELMHYCRWTNIQNTVSDQPQVEVTRFDLKILFVHCPKVIRYKSTEI